MRRKSSIWTWKVSASEHPPVARFFHEKNRQNSLDMICGPCCKILLAIFQKEFHISGDPRGLSRDLFSTGGRRNLAILEVFKTYPSEFSIFFMKLFLISRSYHIRAVHINSSIISALVTLEIRLTLLILVKV